MNHERALVLPTRPPTLYKALSDVRNTSNMRNSIDHSMQSILGQMKERIDGVCTQVQELRSELGSDVEDLTGRISVLEGGAHSVANQDVQKRHRIVGPSDIWVRSCVDPWTCWQDERSPVLAISVDMAAAENTASSSVHLQ